MVLEPGLIRWTITEGPFRDLFVVIDTINNRILWGNRDDGIIGDVKRPINSEHDFFKDPSRLSGICGTARKKTSAKKK